MSTKAVFCRDAGPTRDAAQIAPFSPPPTPTAPASPSRGVVDADNRAFASRWIFKLPRGRASWDSRDGSPWRRSGRGRDSAANRQESHQDRRL